MLSSTLEACRLPRTLSAYRTRAAQPHVALEPARLGVARSISSRTPLRRTRVHALRTKPHGISLRATAESVPPPILPLIGMATVQFGAALGKSLFTSLNPAGVVFLRVASAALILLLVWR